MNPGVDGQRIIRFRHLLGEDGCQNLGVGEQRMVVKTVLME